METKRGFSWAWLVVLVGAVLMVSCEFVPEKALERSYGALPEIDPSGVVDAFTWRHGTWPLKVNTGRLVCEGDGRYKAAWFAAPNGSLWPLNARADERSKTARFVYEMSLESLEDLRLEVEASPGLRVDIGPMIDAALRRCR